MSLSSNKAKWAALRRLIPLNLLPQKHFIQIFEGLAIQTKQKGDFLFRRGDRLDQWIYVLEGEVLLTADGIVMDTIKGGSDAARFPIAQQVPRKVSAQVQSGKLQYIQVDYRQLNHMENFRQKPNHSGQSKGDWVTKLLKSPVFQRLPASNLQKIVKLFQEVELEAGQPVVQQGEQGDCLYIIKSGRCLVSRKPRPNSKDIKLGELKIGEMFGEDALISGMPRSVSVTMLTDGVLLRLGKNEFLELVVKPVLQGVSFESAFREVEEQEAMWLDVRDPDQFKEVHIDHSMNVPFFSMRMQLATLQRKRKYIVVCDDGTTSAAAAFLLLRFGFEAVYLEAGLSAVPDKCLARQTSLSEEETEEELHSPKESEKSREPVAPINEGVAGLSVNPSEIPPAVEKPPSEDLQDWMAKYKEAAQLLEKKDRQLVTLQSRLVEIEATNRQLQETVRMLEIEKARQLSREDYQEMLNELEELRSAREKDQTRIGRYKEQIEELEGVIAQYFGALEGENIEQKVQSIIAELYATRDRSEQEIDSLKKELETSLLEVERLQTLLDAKRQPAVSEEQKNPLLVLEPVEPQHLPLQSVGKLPSATTPISANSGASFLWMMVGILLCLAVAGIAVQMESGRRLLLTLLGSESSVIAEPTKEGDFTTLPSGEVFKEGSEADSDLFEGKDGEDKPSLQEESDGDLFEDQ